MDISIEKEIEKFTLTEEEFDCNVKEVFYELAIGVTKSQNKTFVVVGGQAGAGKTSLVSKKYSELCGNAIIIDQDELRTKFPQDLNRELMKKYDERTGYLILRPYVNRISNEIMQMARTEGYNVIFETALSFLDPVLGHVNIFNNSGYSSELAILTINEIEANFSMLYRYAFILEKNGVCRRATKMRDDSYQRVYENIIKLDDLNILDNVEVYIRNNEVNKLPIKIYSKDIDSNESLAQAIKRGERKSYIQTVRHWDARYEYVRKILMAYGENDKMIELEKLQKRFDTLKLGEVETDEYYR